MWRNRRLKTAARGEAEPPQLRRFGVAGAERCQRQLVVGPGKTAGGVKQPVARGITDAAAHGAERERVLHEGLRAERR